jgi:septum formation protein
MASLSEKLRPLVLASASPRRRRLLEILKIKFEVIPSQVAETESSGETPQEHVSRLAQAKAREVGSKSSDCWVLGADTIVFIDGEILGKPQDEHEAFGMLKKISGRNHQVLTGFFIYCPELGESAQGVVETSVKIKKLSENEIYGYIRSGEPFDKAGAYAVQGIGMFMVEKVMGSPTNVIGLPVCEVTAALRKLGAIQFLV